MPKVFITRPLPLRAYDLLSGHAEIDRNDEERQLDPTELLDRLCGCDAVLCTLGDRLDAPILDAAAPTLRVIANYAVGVDNIDLDAAKRLGITVTNTPDVLTNATAEIAVGLMLATARRFASGDRMMREGWFEGWAPLLHRGQDVYGKRVGIIGAGRIGQRVAATMRHGFGCSIVYHSRTARPDWDADLDARRVPLDELLQTADFVSIHCPLTPETHHLIDARRLALMQRHTILVNTARGAVIDEAALVEALRENRIAGAGLDVFEQEPTAPANPLLQLDNVVVVPHLAGQTYESYPRLVQIAFDNMQRVLDGATPRNLVVRI